MTVDEVIRGRRTLKGFTPEPVDPAVIDELLDLAVYAPNHHTTEPWRFTVIGPATISELVAATDDGKLTRSPTAIVVTQVVDSDDDTAREDYAACACAIQNVMLGARARDIASYWRTPTSLLQPAARKILGLGRHERVIGIVHIGWPADGFPRPPRRTAGTRARRLA
jgi:nitroreductase